MYQDKPGLSCCKQEFVFSAGEQEFYVTKGFQNEPSAAPLVERREGKQGTQAGLMS